MLEPCGRSCFTASSGGGGASRFPDSDSVCSAIALSYLKNQIGEDVKPARLGELSPETLFILEKFGFEQPELKITFADTDGIYVVDHSDRIQGPDDIDDTTVLGIIDHHKFNINY